MPEAKPRDTNITVGIISIWYFNMEPILNAQSEAEGILPMKNTPFILQKGSKSIKYHIMFLGGGNRRGVTQGCEKCMRYGSG